VGSRIAQAAEQAHFQRDLTRLNLLGDMLTVLPLPAEHRALGSYYRGLTIMRFGRGDPSAADPILFSALESSPGWCKGRIILAMAANAARRGDRSTQLELYLEALRAASFGNGIDPLAILQAGRAIAVWKSLLGDGRAALRDLERLAPTIRAIAPTYPQVYYDYLNNLAVEYTAAGRFAEATGACSIALSSRFASAYPEWQETGRDIAALKGHGRSRVALNAAGRPARKARRRPARKARPSRPNVVSMLRRAHSSGSRTESMDASAGFSRVLSFSLAGEKMAKADKRPRTFSRFASLTFNEKQAKAIELLLDKPRTEAFLDRILASVSPGEKEKWIMDFITSTAVSESTLNEILALVAS
jgi:hypothetical protein